MSSQMRKLISDDQVIVVLDTGPVRVIGHLDSTPEWVATFEKMAADGYSFSLADHAWAELVEQYERGAFDRAKLDKILGAISKFLNPDVPILPSKHSLLAMVGEARDATWSEDAERALAAWKWEMLNDPSKLTAAEMSQIRAELQFERDEWIRRFKDLDDLYAQLLASNPSIEDGEPLNEHKHSALNACLNSMASKSLNRNPDLSTRMDLEIRYVWRQWVRSRLQDEPYNPSHPKKINDGIDLDMYKYLMLPAFGVAIDGGFHGSLERINSHQLNWFWHPEELAEAWTSGANPRPNWE